MTGVADDIQKVELERRFEIHRQSGGGGELHGEVADLLLRLQLVHDRVIGEESRGKW